MTVDYSRTPTPLPRPDPARLGHCTPTLGGHSPACDRDGRYCSEASGHAGPCKPHGAPPARCVECDYPRTAAVHDPASVGRHLFRTNTAPLFEVVEVIELRPDDELPRHP